MSELTDWLRKPLAEMTLGEATADPSWRPEIWADFACACVGGPWCCMRRAVQVQALHRAAHITARLIADAADRRRPIPTPPPDLPAETGCPFCDAHGLTGPDHWPHSDYMHEDDGTGIGFRNFDAPYQGPYRAPRHAAWTPLY
jgi:hypothetical protein